MPTPRSVTLSSTSPSSSLGGHRHPRAGLAVGDGVLDEVAERHHELVLVSEDAQADARRRTRPRCPCRPRRRRPGRSPATRRRRRRPVRVVGGLVALQAGQLDDLLHQAVEPLALGAHPLGEPLDRLGIVGGLPDGLGEQGESADRSLQLVADVRDEVAADGVGLALAGAVLGKHEDELAAQRGDPGGDVPSGSAARLDRTSSSSRIWPSRRTVRTSSSRSRTCTRSPLTRPIMCAGALALSTSSSGPTTSADDRSTDKHLGDARQAPSGSGASGIRCWSRSLKRNASTLAPPRATPMMPPTSSAADASMLRWYADEGGRSEIAETLVCRSFGDCSRGVHLASPDD